MDLTEELAWLAFYLPRQAVQRAARILPLATLRDHLPRVIGERLRFGLYPARVTDPLAVTCARSYRPWGDPVELDERLPIRHDQPRVSILVVTYNNLDLTRLCLASLQRCAGALPFEIIVVDNASSDGTPAWLRAVESRALLPLQVELNRDNRGFAAGNNQAAARARGDLLVFLNNDCVVTPGWLDTLVAHLDRDRSLGLVGPVTNSGGNAEAQLGTRYAELDGMLAFARDYTQAHAGQVADVSMLPLFCAAMRRETFNAVGGLDEGMAAACSRTTIWRWRSGATAAASLFCATCSCTTTAAPPSRAWRRRNIYGCGGRIAAASRRSGACAGRSVRAARTVPRPGATGGGARR
jgi:hypothetical protein